jgi:hypothetical protein
MNDDSHTQTATAPRFRYFRYHETPGWGVRDHTGGRVVVTGLDQHDAFAIAAILNGDRALARSLLGVGDLSTADELMRQAADAMNWTKEQLTAGELMRVATDAFKCMGWTREQTHAALEAAWQQQQVAPVGGWATPAEPSARRE